MRITELFTRTLREAPAEATWISHRLAWRAGLVRAAAPGSVALMPLGMRVLNRIAAMVREEMATIGAQEVRLPVIQPAEAAEALSRPDHDHRFSPLLADEVARATVPGAGSEAVVAALAAHEIYSSSQLPQIVYQLQTQHRRGSQGRMGMLGLRAFTLMEAYGLAHYADELSGLSELVRSVYERIFTRLGLEVLAVQAEGGPCGGAGLQFLLPHPHGEHPFARCEQCGYVATVGAAEFRQPIPERPPLEPVRKVATPGCTTIEQVARFLGVSETQTLKAVFFIHTAPDQQVRFVFAVVRGDLTVSEGKLLRALGGGLLRPADEAAIVAVGAVPGYASPIGLPPAVLVVADRSVHAGANYVTGANEAGYHLTGVNVPRDFTPALVLDIATAYDGALCARCDGGTLRLNRAIALGYSAALDTVYGQMFGVPLRDSVGSKGWLCMGSYGLVLERLLVAILETHHDAQGICWPASVAPFDVHIVTLGRDEAIRSAAEHLYARLRAAGCAVLLDDREESAGVKFADADLIGAPLRLVVSQKTLETGDVEVKRRTETERLSVPLEQIVAWLRDNA